jgi:serine/threonine protein kinase
MNPLAFFFSTNHHLLLSEATQTYVTLTVYPAQRAGTSQWTLVSLYSELNQQEFERFVACQSQLKSLNGVVQLYEWGWTPPACANQQSYCYTVQEWVDKDLAQTIEENQRLGLIWPEEALVIVASSLISTLAGMQRMKIAHRNLNLHSFKYIEATTEVKLGDFTQACIVQTPLDVRWTMFMCPELAFIIESGVSQADYDPFKADVYSLGVCLLFCCCLELRESKDVKKNCIIRLQTLQNSTLKSLLYYMLQETPQERPDFITLQEYTQTPGPLSHLNCPHRADIIQWYYFPCHGNFCNTCVNYSSTSLPYCPICGVQYSPSLQYTSAQAITPETTYFPNTVRVEEVHLVQNAGNQALGNDAERGQLGERRETQPLRVEELPGGGERGCLRRLCPCFFPSQ